MSFLIVNAKCNDMCSTVIETETGERINLTNGYVPRSLHIGGGDYIRLKIDLETGKIVGWETPTEDTISDILAG